MKTVEPKWVKDEDVWAKAKKAAAKSDSSDKWALTTYLYKKMGGEIAPKKETASGKDAFPGVNVTHWFWGSEAFLKGPVAAKTVKGKEVPAVKEQDTEIQDKTADEIAQDLLIEAPDMAAATMMNALKAKGVTLSVEADSATSNGAILRGKTKESDSGMTVSARFLEGSHKDNGIGPTRFKVALLQEGLGNLKDAFYYTREAIESGIRAFEGKKCFADHPSRSEESDRPERSVRDIVGHFESVRVEESQDGSAMLCADLVMLPEPAFAWARSLVKHAIDYSKKYPTQEFIGLSINASGEARAESLESFLAEAKIPQGAKPKLQAELAEGLSTVKVVSVIKDAVSTDIVTEPGARGKVLELLESERASDMKKAKQAEAKKVEEMEAKPSMEAKQAEELPAEKPDGEEGEHEDIEQDKKLILDMIKKHMGEAAEGMESDGEMAASEAYEAYKEMGKSHEEAMKCAAEAMKLAKHMAAKQEAACGEAEEKEAEAEEAEEAKHAESAIVKMTARIAFLERELKKHELAKTLDSKLAESKLGRAETDKIRALIGEPKSEGEIVKTIKIFKEAFDMTKGSESPKSKFASLFVTSSEKMVESKEKAKVSFADLVQK